jgi:hypothetical protein
MQAALFPVHHVPLQVDRAGSRDTAPSGAVSIASVITAGKRRLPALSGMARAPRVYGTCGPGHEAWWQIRLRNANRTLTRRESFAVLSGRAPYRLTPCLLQPGRDQPKPPSIPEVRDGSRGSRHLRPTSLTCSSTWAPVAGMDRARVPGLFVRGDSPGGRQARLHPRVGRP